LQHRNNQLNISDYLSKPSQNIHLVSKRKDCLHNTQNASNGGTRDANLEHVTTGVPDGNRGQSRESSTCLL
jgi:hypothetical protein